jgi:molybdopterin-dependent oxidoreductase alpha subunit
MGITEKPAPEFLDRLGREFGFAPPREPGLDTVASIRALQEGRARAFFGLGGNFAVATPDRAVTEEALRRCRLTAHVSTALNRSHLVTGDEAFVLPCLGRSEEDLQRAGPQFVSVEDSMSVVHRSQGRLAPASPELRSECAIVAGLARAVLGRESAVPWEELVADYDRIRERIERVVQGFEDYNRRVRRAEGFVLPNAARGRRFETAIGRAVFTVHRLPDDALAPGCFRLTSVRSHDQFNTTVYGFDDRYRGVSGDRRVVFLNPEDLREAGLRDDDRVDLTSQSAGVLRRLTGFRVIPYDVPRRCAAAYFPEVNALVPLESVAEQSHTPTYKSIDVSIRRSEPDGDALG